MTMLKPAGLAAFACLVTAAALAAPNPQDPFLAPVSAGAPAAATLLVPPRAPAYLPLAAIQGATTGNLFAVVAGGAWTKADFDPIGGNGSLPVSLATAVAGSASWTTANGGVLTLANGALTYANSSGFLGDDVFNMALSAQVQLGAGVVDNWSNVIQVDVTVTPAPATGNVIRFRNAADGTHFYTSDPVEVGNIANGMPFLVNEGFAFKAVVPPPGAAGSSLAPVYRFFQRNTGLHLLSQSTAEINFLVTQAISTSFAPEAVPFAAYVNPGTGVPVYRLFNAVNGDHLLTTSAGERSQLLQAVPRIWFDEGIAFYGAP